MSMNKERLQFGLDALRSGEFEQCTGSLRNVDYDDEENVLGTSYCCLGVLSEVAVRNGVKFDHLCLIHEEETCACDEDRVNVKEIWQFVGETLSKPVREWYGFDRDDPRVASNAIMSDGEELQQAIMATIANDDLKWDFDQIADGFEKTYMTPEADGDARPAE